MQSCYLQCSSSAPKFSNLFSFNPKFQHHIRKPLSKLFHPLYGWIIKSQQCGLWALLSEQSHFSFSKCSSLCRKIFGMWFGTFEEKEKIQQTEEFSISVICFFGARVCNPSSRD